MYIQTRNFGYKKAFLSLFEDERCDRTPRTHQFSEIQCVLSGSFNITVDGVSRIANAGDIAVITPFRVHSVKAVSAGSKLWICAFSNDFVSDFIGNELSFEPGTESVFTPEAPLFNYVMANLTDTFETVVDLEGNAALYHKMKALIYAVFEKYVSVIPQSPVPIKNHALASVLLYMNEHFKEDITRESVASAIGYNPSYISHCIEMLPDMSFRKLLNSLRTEYAKSELLSTDRSILDIAMECGYANERSFYRAFGGITGTTPGEYRRQARSKSTGRAK